MKSKIIQISACEISLWRKEGGSGNDADCLHSRNTGKVAELYALCEDGSVWVKSHLEGGSVAKYRAFFNGSQNEWQEIT
jgi:hypothetical protein